MTARGNAKVMTIVGVMLLAGGMASLAVAPLPMKVQGSFVLPVLFLWNVIAGGRVDCIFSVGGGSPISVYVLTYQEYIASGGSGTSRRPGNLYNITAPAGQFSLDLPDRGTFYVIFQGSAGESVSIDLTLSGIQTYPFVAGIILLAPSPLLLWIGIRRLRAPKLVAPTWK